ncbi:MAG: glycosyltransferase family 4 protein [Candidatus Nanopelagicales bacterium]|jgi:phosphatidyl-myo-inositol dimannoside synthase|nr:glycosyltransferase family 4 protein [Candidatus Nanopelagicales bacterium]MDP4746646.1 glycosyltransferase family 4 protein [Candidatus Nanopelagicales bacterium]
MSKTLVITNDFPPRPGGIQTFIYGLVQGFDPDDVVVLTSKHTGWQEFDKQEKYPIFRHNTQMLLPTKAVGDQAITIIKEFNCDRVLFGASAPLGLLANRLKNHGIKKTVAITHGHEVGWAFTPGLKQTFQKIVKDVDKLTYLTKFTFEQISEAISSDQLEKFEQLTPGIDINMFNPENKTNGQSQKIRERFRLGNKPVVVCVSRLMARKGQDTLIEVWPEVLKKVPDAHLLIVGGGSLKQSLHKKTFDNNVHTSVTITGAVDWKELPGFYAAGDVFAMPVRTRNLGFDVEGLGIVYLEASATGIPVIAGNSGGAPEAVIDGVTGFVLNPNNQMILAEKIIELLLNKELSNRLGKQGRSWIEKQWQWPSRHLQLKNLLSTDMS